MNKNNQTHVGMPKKAASQNKAAKQYTAPDIEIIDIELTQNILGGSPVSDPLPGMPGRNW